MKAHPSGFDGVAGIYRALELLAFGGDLERARFCFVDELRCRGRILILGEGDGRFLARLVGAAPDARIHCVDSSPAMTALAAARVPGAGARVSFEQADVLGLRLDPATYDAVVTFFFLDCFTPEQVSAIESRIRPSLRVGARWLFADFALPPRGLPRWRAKAWLWLLYRFFGWKAGLRVQSLPPSEDIILKGGFRRVATREFQAGLVRSVVFDSQGPRAASEIGVPAGR